MNRKELSEKLTLLKTLEVLPDDAIYWKPQGKPFDSMLTVVPYQHVISVNEMLNQYFENNWRISFTASETNVKATIELIDDDGVVCFSAEDVSDIKEQRGDKENTDSDAGAATSAVRRAFRWICPAALELWRTGRTIKAWAFDDPRAYPKYGIDVMPSWAYVMECWNAGDTTILPERD